MNDSELMLTCLCGEILTEENSKHGVCKTCLEDEWTPVENEDMDGDHESGLASAGHGTDEDYGYYGEDTPMYEDYYGGE